MTRVPVTRLPDGRLVYQGANGQFGIKQDVRVITPAQRWLEIDQLPLHLKRFLWWASIELVLDPRKPNDLASLEARERARVRATALKFYGPDHPQASADFKPLDDIMPEPIDKLRAKRTALDHKLAVNRDQITALQGERTRLAAERATVVADLAKATTKAASAAKKGSKR